MNLEIVAKPVHLGTNIAYLNQFYCEVLHVKLKKNRKKYVSSKFHQKQKTNTN